MKTSILIIMLFLSIIIPIASAEVYVGTCDGYVFNTEGQLVSGAYVKATVDRCEVACSQETATESTGYYVTANLNLPKHETLTIYAEKQTALGLEFGSRQGISNEFQAARVNVTICLPPPKPLLVDEPNTHNTEVKLEWTSYSDKKNYNVYDEFKVDSGSILRIPGSGSKSQDVTELIFSNHLWRVRTCNPFCCSAWVSDTFNVGNLPPSKPILTPQPDTAPGTVNLEWVSGTDPDGDETYDEYSFGIINENYIYKNVTSPQTEEVVGCNYYLWKARTCEKEVQHLCSDWSEDGFIACGLECPECYDSPNPVCSDGDGGGGCGSPYSLTVTYPPAIEERANLTLNIRLSTAGTIKDVSAKVISNEFAFNDFMMTQLGSMREARFSITGKQVEETPIGDYNFTLEIYANKRKVLSNAFDIRVKKAPSLLVRITRKVKEMPKKTGWLLTSLILIFLLIIALVVIREIQKRKSVPKAKKPQILAQPFRKANIQK